VIRPRHPEGEAMSTTDDIWIDLADRESDGLEVTLLWSSTTGRVKVAVSDSKLGEDFELAVARADALAAFHHPFAYASRLDLNGRASRVHPDLQPQH
jgi:hypothetical protein